jgi:hypothetical protein
LRISQMGLAPFWGVLGNASGANLIFNVLMIEK